MAIKKRLSARSSPLPEKDEPEAKLGKSSFVKAGLTDEQVRLVSMQHAYHHGGDDPKTLPVEDVLHMVRAPNWHDNVESFYRNRIRSPLTAVRAFCVFCAGGSPKQANECGKTTCPLWAFRTGKNPFYGKMSNAEATD